MSEETHLILQLAEKVEALTQEVRELRAAVQQDKNRKKWYTMAEFCKIMKISRTTVQERLRAGRYCWAMKDGKNWRFPADQVERITANLAR